MFVGVVRLCAESAAGVPSADMQKHQCRPAFVGVPPAWAIAKPDTLCGPNTLATHCCCLQSMEASGLEMRLKHKLRKSAEGDGEEQYQPAQLQRHQQHKRAKHEQQQQGNKVMGWFRKGGQGRGDRPCGNRCYQVPLGTYNGVQCTGGGQDGGANTTGHT